MTEEPAAAGWYEDPYLAGWERFWDGTAWTAERREAGSAADEQQELGSDRAMAPPGWYDDPTAPDSQRFWNGEAWTDDRRPQPPDVPTTSETGSEATPSTRGGLPDVYSKPGRSREDYRSPWGLSVVVRVVFVGWVAYLGVLVGLELAFARLEAQLLARPFSIDVSLLQRVDEILNTLLTFLLPAWFATGALFIVWLWRAYSNLEPLGALDLRFGRDATIFGWIVPFLNIWRPKQVVDDAWRASDPEVRNIGTTWQGVAVPWYFHVWWLTFLLWSVPAATVSAAATSVSDLVDLGQALSISHGIAAIAALTAYWVTTSITRRQLDRRQALATAEGFASPRSTKGSMHPMVVSTALAALAIAPAAGIGFGLTPPPEERSPEEEFVAFFASSFDDSGISGESWACVEGNLRENGYFDDLEVLTPEQSASFANSDFGVGDLPPHTVHAVEGVYFYMFDPVEGCLSPQELQALGSEPAQGLPMVYGSHAQLDALYDACGTGSLADCDMLLIAGPPDSEYLAYALACGGLNEVQDPMSFSGCQALYSDFGARDDLVEQCLGGFYPACDVAYFTSLIGSDAERIGLTCGNRREANQTVPCTLLYGIGERDPG